MNSFSDNPKRGTSCLICRVFILDKSPSSKSRHLRTKMHHNNMKQINSDLFRQSPIDQADQNAQMMIQLDKSAKEIFQELIAFHE